MEDYEVRQALAIIKDRVNEITNQVGWKDKLVQEWNAAQKEEDAQQRAKEKERKKLDLDSQSKVSYCKLLQTNDVRIEGFKRIVYGAHFASEEGGGAEARVGQVGDQREAHGHGRGQNGQQNCAGGAARQR